ncbi:MAG TPA: DUF6265 family protein [Flavobacterium sp.]|jgi:hypothetical protein
MKSIFPIICIAFLAFACQKKESPVLPEVPKSEKYTELAKVKWLIGNWENTSAEGDWSEIWTRGNDSAFIAKSFFVVKKDTVFSESVELFEQNDKLVYSVTVPTENPAKPVDFTSTEIKDDVVTFTNPNHDYPSKIVYRLITSDSLVATISGIQKGQTKSEVFAMTRTK